MVVRSSGTAVRLDPMYSSATTCVYFCCFKRGCIHHRRMQVDFHNEMANVTTTCQRQCAQCWGNGSTDVEQLTSPLLACYALCSVNPEGMIGNLCK